MAVRVQTEDFDLTTEIAQLRANTPKVGAIVNFVGVVRDLNEFIEQADVIVANRVTAEITDVSEKIYSRDIFSSDD